MKYLLLIFIIFNIQAIPYQFSKFNIISAEKVNENVHYLNNMLEGFGYDLNWSDKSENSIILKNDFVNLFNYFNNHNIITSEYIKSDELNSGFSILESEVINVIPTSCKDIKLHKPDAQSGVYYIDDDGILGSREKYQVYCDMETDGGGWTNIAENIGSYTNQLINNPRLGISDNTNAINPDLGGELVSIHGDKSCNTNSNTMQKVTFADGLLERYHATEVKIITKSYGDSNVICGGSIFRVTHNGVTAISNFDLGQISTCRSKPDHFGSQTNYNYLEYKFNIASDDIVSVASLCNDNYYNSYVQIKSIMVR